MGKTAILAILVLCAAAALWGLGSREKARAAASDASGAAAGETEERDLPLFSDRNGPVSTPSRQVTENTGPVQITGRVRLVGNAPFSEPVLSSADNDWYFESTDQKRMAELQQRTVTVEGIYYEETLHSVNSTYSLTRRVLRAGVRITAID